MSLTEPSFFGKFKVDSMTLSSGRRKPLLYSYGSHRQYRSVEPGSGGGGDLSVDGEEVFDRSAYFIERASFILLVMRLTDIPRAAI